MNINKYIEKHLNQIDIKIGKVNGDTILTNKRRAIGLILIKFLNLFSRYTI